MLTDLFHLMNHYTSGVKCVKAIFHLFVYIFLYFSREGIGFMNNFDLISTLEPKKKKKNQ